MNYLATMRKSKLQTNCPNLLTSDPNGTMTLWNALCNPSFLTEASTVPPMTSACPQGLARGPVHCSCGPRSPWSPPSSAPLPERDDAEESATGIAASRVQSRGKMSSVRLKNVNTALTHLTVPYWGYQLASRPSKSGILTIGNWNSRGPTVCALTSQPYKIPIAYGSRHSIRESDPLLM